MVSSLRGRNLSESPIRHLIPYANEAKAQGKHVFHLNIGQPDIQTPESARQAVKNLEQKIIKYGPSDGLPELKGVVANYYSKFNADLDPSNIYVTTGASEAIMFALLACCDNNDELIIPEPFYANYLGFSHLANVKIKPVTTTIENSFALPSIESFEKSITPSTKAILLCNPGNPTGQLYAKSDLIELAKLVKAKNLFLVVDEVYKEFCYDDEFTSVLSLDGIEEHVIVIDSISKVFSSCGARVGFLISKNKSILSSVNKYAQLRLCPPHYGQVLAIECYKNGQAYINSALEEYRLRRTILFEELGKIDDIKYYKPPAAFYNMVELPIEDAEHFCKWLLTDFNYDNQTLMLAPGDGFYYNKALGKSTVRIAYILNQEDLKKAIHCLKLGLLDYQKNH